MHKPEGGGALACRARMVESRSQALLTFPMTIQRTSPQAGVQQAIWAVLVCQLLETKLLQVLRFQAGQVRPSCQCIL